MSVVDSTYQWLVLGAGPAGVAVVGNLLENGIEPSEIAWVDPFFQSGDFGRLWGEVSGNTKMCDFLNYLGVVPFRRRSIIHSCCLKGIATLL